MFELVQASESAYYINCPVKMGIVKISDTEVCAIDTGLDASSGRKLLQIIEKQGWTLKAIYNTHSHADHIGGNAYLYTHTKCKIYAPKVEAVCITNTELEPAFLMGAYPAKHLRHKFFMAQSSPAMPIEEGTLLGGMTGISLAGHSFNMYGYRTADNVVYLGDALASKESIDKYKIVYAFDIGSYIETLEAIKTLDAKFYIPSHVEPSDDISELLQYNIDKANEVGEFLLEICQEAKIFDYLLQAIYTRYGLVLEANQHALAGSVIRSYLAWLKDTGRIDIYFENNMMYWKSV